MTDITIYWDYEVMVDNEKDAKSLSAITEKLVSDFLGEEYNVTCCVEKEPMVSISGGISSELREEIHYILLYIHDNPQEWK